MDTVTATSSTSRFRFRDIPVDDDSTDGHSSADISSVSSELDVDHELQSMTAKGITHLCSELLELKRESEEDFQKIIFTNYSAFIGIFEGTKNLESDLLQLKYQVVKQKGLIKDLTSGVFLKFLAEESNLEDSFPDYTSLSSIIDAHTNEVSEILDDLLSEHRLDEAISFLEKEAEFFKDSHLAENPLTDELTCYNSKISEKTSMIADQLTLVAKNPRVSAPELQKALVGLRRIGESDLATQLLLKYYHSRIAAGTHDLFFSKAYTHELYLREISKFLFSMISQAAKSFTLLHGENSPYESELHQWMMEQTAIFAVCFNNYVISMVEPSTGLSTAVEAVQSTMAYCSLLEAQGIELQSTLIEHIRPCIQEVLQIHVEHFKKVIGIFTSCETWVLGRYLVSGILSPDIYYTNSGQLSEYSLLANSGRKFITLNQAILEEVFPLIQLHMDGLLLRGLLDLFTEYTAILESALMNQREIEEVDSRTNIAESVEQQVSLIANLSKLAQIFSSMIRRAFGDTYHLQLEIDNYELFINENCGRLRSQFCKQLILKSWPLESRPPPGCCTDLEPTVSYQELYFALRNLKEHDTLIEMDWLNDLFIELMEMMFEMILDKEEISKITDEHLPNEWCVKFIQLTLDIHFLLEIAKWGGYLSDTIMNAYLDSESRMKSTFLSVGMDPERHMIYVKWATKTAIETLQKLHELDKKEMLSGEFINNTEEETNKSTESLGSIDATKSEEVLRSLDQDIIACIKIPETGILPKEGDASVVEENGFINSNNIGETKRTSVEVEGKKSNPLNSEEAIGNVINSYGKSSVH
ncbi:exocyst complex component EXO84A-like isoform X1 [Lycium barbarum]|uniref:exocyst complex component EXO84A-like isoform X1 n=1 Tax=Lycium barbarum TaxID=112863 RepID=UPI00293E8B2A|nr:exocyst complex component EXO84A-like isoform X1 [Lycium barbarum]